MTTTTNGSLVKLAPGEARPTAALDLLSIESWWASAEWKAVGGGDMRVALALGGGGARGYAHIGVIQVLEECGLDIAGVAGSSMGALVGGLYAAGKLDAYVDWAHTIGYREVLRLLDPAVRAPGAFRADTVMARVGELLDGVRIQLSQRKPTRRTLWTPHSPV